MALDNEDKKVVVAYGIFGTLFLFFLGLFSLIEMGYLKKLNVPDNFIIYLWFIVGGVIILGAAVALIWAIKNNQFDEDIKYEMFTGEDDDRFLRAHEEWDKKQREQSTK